MPKGGPMARELYFTVEGPKGKAEIFEITSEATSGADTEHSWEPEYEVQFEQHRSSYTSEGEAITAAQELVGAESVY
jgi:hypothetical protein